MALLNVYLYKTNAKNKASYLCSLRIVIVVFLIYYGSASVNSWNEASILYHSSHEGDKAMNVH